MTKKHFTSATLQGLSFLKLGPDTVIELMVPHDQPGCTTIPRKARGLVRAVRNNDDGTRDYMVLFPFDVLPEEDSTFSDGIVRSVPSTRLKVVANTNAKDFRFGRLQKRAITAVKR